MASEIIVENLNVTMQKVMDKLGVKSYKIQIDGKSEIGDNYMGEVIFFTIFSADDKRVYNFVMKGAKSSEKLRSITPVEVVYKRESFIYTEVFPYFQKFIDEKNPNFEFDCVPKLYWVDRSPRKETLIFDNLKTKGFKLHDRKQPWNLEHSLLAMKYYGKFHALSFALRDQKPEVFKNFNKNLPNLFEDFSRIIKINQIYEEPFKNVKELLQKAGRNDLVNKLEFWSENLSSIFENLADENDKLVICHADCWNNNFMFTYQNNEDASPSKMAFLDFQLSIVDTPVYDLAYNIYATCDKSCLDHFDLLLETYYKSLSSSIRNLGSNPDELFTYEQLKQHWQKYSHIGIIISIVIIKLELLDKADAPDMAKLTEDGENVDDYLNVKVRNQEEYNRRILEIFTHYGDIVN
ncbi:hypothetical protein HHI36_012466 [Cryptolaemus montrouzieri]|uniref:CHK kinase-like domain-containing protein n=1 Tax=Cryptolaemus montrouzieri TaxID=559131 RepID=A0ABD2NEC6_9CUCU